MKADLVAVERRLARAQRLAHPERRAGTPQVPDRLTALTLDLADSVPAERAEEVTVEGQAALDRRNDEVDVVDPCGAHGNPRSSSSAARGSLLLGFRHAGRLGWRALAHRAACRVRRGSFRDRRRRNAELEAVAGSSLAGANVRERAARSATRESCP